jgi:uncharacterized alpha-E superfamily protein
MLSRVADCLYWMSRYLERAEHTLRLLDVNMSLMLDRSSMSADRRWNRALQALGSPEDIEWDGDLNKLAYALTIDGSNPFSVKSCIISARENARQVREQISTEQWQRLNRLFHQVTTPDEGRRSEDYLAEFMPSVLDGIHLFQGITDSLMSHGEGWQFIQVGRYLERASATALLIEVYNRDLLSDPESLGEHTEQLEMIGLLRSCTAFEGYCKVYTADLHYTRILEFILLNPEFPHSLRYSIDTLNGALEAIHKDAGRQWADDLMRLTGRLQSSLSFMQISEMLEQDAGEYLRTIVRQCHQIHNLIYERYIHYSVQMALAD